MPAIADLPPAVAPGPRARKTSSAVRLVDKLTTRIITAGGILVIVAVLGILVFLAAVVVPLFRGAKISEPHHVQLFTPEQAANVLFGELNEYKNLGMALDRNGRLSVFAPATGQIKEQRDLLPAGASVTAFARTLRGGHMALGFSDGSVRLGLIQFRAGEVDAKIENPVRVGEATVAVALLDYKVTGNREVLTALKADGELSWNEVTRKENVVTGEVSLQLNNRKLPFIPGAKPPSFLVQNGQGDQVYIAWSDGTARRLDLRRIEEPVVAETRNLLDEPGSELTDLRFMFGDQSIVASDSRGHVTVWFRVERPGARTADGYQLVAAHRLQPHHGSVIRTAMSSRDKSLLSATSNGEVWLRHMTSEQVLGRLRLPDGLSALALQITPKADGIFALDAGGGAWLWNISNPHPETTLKTIFGKVWYEGYPEPTYTWQSSSGSDDFEPKFSLVPLTFGTLKATFYSLLFAVPIALLSAIYTSQFLDKKLRLPIKSAIETMASLPSVVLGFIAALVLAPIIENWVAAVLTALALVPLTVLVFGYLWQMLPQPTKLRFEGWPHFALLIALVALGVMSAARLGGPIEGLMFHGDFKAWLDGRVGTGAPGIAILAWPIALAVTWYAQRKLLPGRLSMRLSRMSRMQAGLVELGKLLAILAAATALAGWAGTVLAAMGVDPRHVLVGTYVQRNTLVVGFVMGFAVIPIIYTLSEDALSSVPEHLRSASLGCGATLWQTSTRVILPVAMSGIFSAVMIGLGRAVGETMIVVMAAGNTPVIDINVFNGLRALSANIAVELPEAVKDGTLYRMLFLAALSLFVVTFVLNTVAEIVRMRFRKRAFQL